MAKVQADVCLFNPLVQKQGTKRHLGCGVSGMPRGFPKEMFDLAYL